MDYIVLQYSFPGIRGRITPSFTHALRVPMEASFAQFAVRLYNVATYGQVVLKVPLQSYSHFTSQVLPLPESGHFSPGKTNF